MKKTCPVCYIDFETPQMKRKYCSNTCYRKTTVSLSTGVPINLKCVTCGKFFLLRYGNQVTCSTECAQIHRKTYLKGYHFKKLMDEKEIVLKMYGDACNCCGEATPEFLSIDHIQGGGTQQRKKDSKWRYPWRMLAQLPYQPDLYQVLCFNCNQAKSKGRVCPHKALTDSPYQLEFPGF